MACVGRLSGLFVLQKSDFSRPDIYEWCAFLSSFSCKVRPRVWSNYRNFYLVKHDFNGRKRKSVYGKTEQEAKRKRREWKKNVNSSAVLGNDRITVGQPMKRYQKILVRQNRAPGARQNRAGCRHRDYRQRSPSTESGPKCRWKPFSLFEGTFPVLLNTELKTGILTGLRRSRGDYDIPLSKATTEKRPADIDRALFCWTEGIMKLRNVAGFGGGFSTCSKGEHYFVVLI